MEIKPPLKIIFYIKVCTLAAMLMTFATVKAQVNEPAYNLYTPVKMKMRVSYYDKNGSIKQYRITTKDILNQLGYGKNYKLALRNSYFDVWLLNGQTAVSDLTASGHVFINFNDGLVTETYGKNDTFIRNERGILDVNVYCNPQFIEGVFDQAASKETSEEWLEVSGLYTLEINGWIEYPPFPLPPMSPRLNLTSVRFNSSSLGGKGSDSTSEHDVPTPTIVTGSITTSGKSKNYEPL